MTNAIDMGRPPTLDGEPCRYCKAEIAFARTPKRALMPLDVEPVRAEDVPPAARYAYDADEVSTRPAPDAAWVYLPHFTTCPETSKEPTNAALRVRWTQNRRNMR